MSHLALKGARREETEGKHPLPLHTASIPQACPYRQLYLKAYLHRVLPTSERRFCPCQSPPHYMQPCLKIFCLSASTLRRRGVRYGDTFASSAHLGVLAWSASLCTPALPTAPSWSHTRVWLPAGPHAQTRHLLPTGSFTGSLHSPCVLSAAGTIV